MPDQVTPKLTQYQQRRAKGLTAITIWVEPRVYQQLKLVSSSVGDPITSWCRRAVIGAMTRWKRPEMDKSLWPRCNVCGTKHDEQDHYREKVYGE